MAEILYRQSVNPVVPAVTAAKGAPLSNAEIDGNFKSIQTDLSTKASTTQLSAVNAAAIDNAVALSIALG